MTVADRQVTGPEAAEIYAQRYQELRRLRNHRVHEADQRQALIDVVAHAPSGSISITEALQATGLDVVHFLPLLTDMLEDGQVVAQGQMLVLQQAPAATA